jgi:hypothetical protein
MNHAFSKQKEGSRVANLFDLASRGVVERIKLPSRGPQALNAFSYRRIELLSMCLLRGLLWRAPPRVWVMYASEPLPFVSFEIIRIRPPAIVAVNHGHQTLSASCSPRPEPIHTAQSPVRVICDPSGILWSARPKTSGAAGSGFWRRCTLCSASSGAKACIKNRYGTCQASTTAVVTTAEPFGLNSTPSVMYRRLMRLFCAFSHPMGVRLATPLAGATSVIASLAGRSWRPRRWPKIH